MSVHDGLGGRLALAEPDSLSGPAWELFDRIIADTVPWAAFSTPSTFPHPDI